MKFTDRLWNSVEDIWNGYLRHPFVTGLGDGTLEVDKFQHWLKQDYVYLVEYSRLMAIGAEKAPDLQTMNMFSEMLHGTLFGEMELHRKYAAEFGIEESELLKTEPSAVNTAYTSYMLNHAQRGDAAAVAACLLACAWSYNYIGRALADKNPDQGNNPYKQWVDTYSGEDFSELNGTAMTLLNELADGKPERELKQLEEIVVKTSLYEYMFWDMCEECEEWPVQLNL